MTEAGRVLMMKGLPLTCSPAHFTLTSYESGSGGVNTILYLSSPTACTSTGTSPHLLPTQVAFRSPLPASEASKSRPTAVPAVAATGG